MNNFEICKTALGVAGSALIWAFGKWDTAIQTLLIFMAVDYLTGLAVAGFWRKSPKTKTGGLNSTAGLKGLLRKCAVLCMVLIANMLDRVTGTNFVRDAVIIAYIINEAVSIIENIGIMGVPVPKALVNAIDALKSKEEE